MAPQTSEQANVETPEPRQPATMSTTLTSREVSARFVGRSLYLANLDRSHAFRDLLRERFERVANAFAPQTMARRNDAVIGAPLSRMFEERKLAFIHIPKCAGTSVSFALYGTQAPHVSVQDLRRFYPHQSAGWQRFAVVRDPMERFVSAANFVAAGGIHPATARFRDLYLEDASDLNKFVRRSLNHYAESPLSDVLFRPQTSFLLLENGDLDVDWLLDYRALGVGLKAVVGNQVDLPRLNAGDKKVFHLSMLDNSSLDILNKVFRDDITLYQLVREATQQHGCAGLKLS